MADYYTGVSDNQYYFPLSELRVFALCFECNIELAPIRLEADVLPQYAGRVVIKKHPAEHDHNHSRNQQVVVILQPYPHGLT
jgi:hypothetical protein